jgi:hypothetical protein
MNRDLYMCVRQQLSIIRGRFLIVVGCLAAYVDVSKVWTTVDILEPDSTRINAERPLRLLS